MAPSAVEMIGKKKRGREKREGASTSTAASRACEPKQRKRRAQRFNSQAPGACTSFSLIQILADVSV
jgi:hypothetical protein